MSAYKKFSNLRSWKCRISHSKPSNDERGAEKSRCILHTYNSGTRASEIFTFTAEEGGSGRADCRFAQKVSFRSDGSIDVQFVHARRNADGFGAKQ